MPDIDKKFTGSIPEFYDTYLVPLIFGAYAEDLAERVERLSPGAVLEVAAGTGVVARALAPRLSGDVRYVATDLNQPMLDHAASKHPREHPIEWQQADALSLPFDDQSFDVVICQFGAMFFPDQEKGFREARRVLKPGGRLIFNMWDHIRENEFAALATEAASLVFPADPPLFLARTPHGHHDKEKTVSLLKLCGYSEIVVETLSEQSRATAARHPAVAYCHGTPLRNEIEERDPEKLDEVTDRAERLIAGKFGSGAISAKIQALIFSAAN